MAVRWECPEAIAFDTPHELEQPHPLGSHFHSTAELILHCPLGLLATRQSTLKVWLPADRPWVSPAARHRRCETKAGVVGALKSYVGALRSYVSSTFLHRKKPWHVVD